MVRGMNIQLAVIELHYLMNREGKIILVNKEKEVKALLARDLPIHVELADYGKTLPPEWIQKFSEDDQTFFTVDILNDNHNKSFKNIKKPFFGMRIQVFEDADAIPEPHFVAFILK